MIGKDFNVKHKSSQHKGFGSKTCASLGLQFILHTRPTTTFSGPLQNLINSGTIAYKFIRRY
jgi:hypothetical protein